MKTSQTASAAVVQISQLRMMSLKVRVLLKLLVGTIGTLKRPLVLMNKGRVSVEHLHLSEGLGAFRTLVGTDTALLVHK